MIHPAARAGGGRVPPPVGAGALARRRCACQARRAAGCPNPTCSGRRKERGERTQPADTRCERQPPLRQRRANLPLAPRKRDGSPRRTAATGRSPAAAPAAESSALTPEEPEAMPRAVAAPRRLPVERLSATGAASWIVRQRAGRARNSRAPRRPRDRRAGPTRRASVPSASPPRGARGGAKRGLGSG